MQSDALCNYVTPREIRFALRIAILCIIALAHRASWTSAFAYPPRRATPLVTMKTHAFNDSAFDRETPLTEFKFSKKYIWREKGRKVGAAILLNALIHCFKNNLL